LVPPKEESESAHELPRPELNPLVNPLLGENMGKWAEVYFTSPPEKREEAVLDLIRELKAGESSAEGAVKSQPSGGPSTRTIPDIDFPVPDFSARNDGQMLGHCRACGHENPATHQFCGMCGEKLSSQDDSQSLPETAAETRHERDGTFFRSPHNIFREARGTTSGLDSETASDQLYDQLVDETDELARLRRISTGNEDAPDFSWVEPSPSRRYGIYVGVAVVVIAVLAYVGWLGSLTSQAHHNQPAAPVTATEPAPAPATTTTAEAPAATPAPTQPVPAPAAVPATRDNSQSKARENGTIATVSDKQTPPALQQASLGNGEEELAIAQRYLSGGTGLQRNSAEAAQWLWKSIAKHNSSATLLLADLYLRGDGVSKNCDQARVLLDSAARKGVEGAGERLRNLQAFGCQ
jgi:hypothetical protein